MQHTSTLENSYFNVVLLKYLWHMTAVLGHSKSKSISLIVKWHLQWSQTGWLSLDRRYEWVIRLWPILRRVMTVSSRRHNDVHGLFCQGLVWLKTANTQLIKLYNMSQKTRHLIFDHNSSNCRPIFKTSSLIDSQVNFAYKIFHVILTLLLCTLACES